MDEMRFVLKCFALAAFLVALSQIKTANGTVETQMHAALVSSETSAFVNKAASGGTKAIKEGWNYIQSQFAKRSSPDEKKSETSKSVDKTVIQQEAIKKIESDQSTAQLQNQVLQEEDSVDDLIEEVQ
jgi:hypothetical protein